MTKKSTIEIQVSGTWSKNIPMFMDDLYPQIKYDTFMALKHNLSHNKVLPVIFHRICGDYDTTTPVVFTEKFKLLKKWLFLTDRTDKLPSGAYLVMWKAWKTYQEAGYHKIPSCEDIYESSLEDLFPKEYHMYISSRPLTQPLYYMYNKGDTSRMIVDNKDRQEKEPEFDEYGNPRIPAPILIQDTYIQTSKLFEYMNRHYTVMPCDYCGHNLTIQSLCVSLSCTHFVHHTCTENYQCLKCESDKVSPWFSRAMELESLENEDNTSYSV
jgi:hypothetical protein